ncbi:MAG: radical SAM protein [Clostridia bacterium]|nr:radical SAM protein [Clostridia bacterium]
MKKVYFVQANLSYGKTYYLPYATGCLAAYAWQYETIKNNYEIGEFIFKRDSIETVMNNIADPAVVAFSCYTWTWEYNKTLASAIKNKYPDCVIVFGGHSISENVDVFAQLPYVDFFIYGEGERAFKEILEQYHTEKNYFEIKNIAYRENGKIIITSREYYENLNGYLSPYLEGYFEKITQANPDTEFCAVIETNRGCPYNCAYCDWCYSQNIRQFPIDKVKEEIVWCSKNKVEYIFCADGNFGILKRDLEIAEFVVDIKKKHGYPHIFNTCFAKNSNETVFEISKLFYENHMNKAATLAYQTVSDTALKNVNRTNFTMDAFAELVKKYNESGIPTYTEMILGLPGETYESFCEGLCKLIEAGQQSALTVYYCQVYPNAIMGRKEYREKHGIVTAHVPLNYLHSTMPSADDITEYTDIIVSTNDMSFNDMIKSIMFCTSLQCFHHIGLLKFFAVYLRNEKNISYLDFYTRLLEFIFNAKGTFLYSLFNSFRNQCSDFSNGEWSYFNERFGEIGWFLEEGAFLEIVSNIEEFWIEIIPFLKSFQIDNEIFSELLKFQKFAIRLPGQEFVCGEFEYDFYTYFKTVISSHQFLEKRKVRIKVNISNPVYNWKDYARKVVLYAKRRGDTIITNDRQNVEIISL